MRFSQIISALKNGKSKLLDHDYAKDPEIMGAASVEKAKSDQISFLEKNNSLAASLLNSDVGAIIIANQEHLLEKVKNKNIAWALVDDPRLAFAEILELLHPRSVPHPELHPTAVIGNNVKIDGHVYIGPNVSIGDNASIGEGTIIYPGVVIYPGAVVGKDCELHANCVLYPSAKLGDRCVIQANAVVGGEGFGFVPTKHGWHKMPQTGVVILENDVEIGCGTTIDRPAVGETRVGRGTKIDNLVQIGHGVTTGDSCAIAAQVGIAGGATLGKGVILAGQAGVVNRVKVGDRVVASSRTGVHTDVAPGEVISGFPAMSNRLWLKCSANIRKLPELARQIKQLARDLPE